MYTRQTTEVNEINRYKRENQNRSGGRGQKSNSSTSHIGGEGQGKCRNCGNNDKLHEVEKEDDPFFSMML